MQIIEIEKLGKFITFEDAERFKAWGDKFSDQNIALTKIIDQGSISLLNTETSRHKERLNLSEDEATNQFRKWNHVQLSKYVSKIWSGVKNTTHIDLDRAYNDFQVNINSLALDIDNVAGEQKLLLELHFLANKYGNPASNSPEKDILTKC